MRFVLDNDVKEVVLTGASGGRIDHYLANFQLLVYLEKYGVRACIEEENMTAWAVHDREQTVVGHTDDLLSVLQMTEELQLSESGVFYPLDHYDVEFRLSHRCKQCDDGEGIRHYGSQGMGADHPLQK